MRYLLPLVFLLAGCGCVSVPSHDAVRAMTHRIDVQTVRGIMGCSATAIGPDKLLTASHCVDSMIALYVDEKPATVVSVTTDDDRAIATLSAPVFATWAQIGPTPKQGDPVRWWGNPRGVTDVYRESVVAAVEPTLIALDAMVCHGDSGSGIFNASGQVVAVMSRMAPDVGPCVFGVAQL